MDSKFLNNFRLVSPKDRSCEIWFKLSQWFRRRCHLKTLWTDDADERYVITAPLDPLALVSSKAKGVSFLKKHSLSFSVVPINRNNRKLIG